jgi:hypothetical protein
MLPSALAQHRIVRRTGLIAGLAIAGMIASATPALAHAGFSSYAGFSNQPNPLGSTSSPYAPGTRYTLVVRAAVETTSPYNNSDDTNVKVEINVPSGWTDPVCGSAMLQVNNSGTGSTNQPGAAVNGWSCSVSTVGSNKVIRFTGPQVVSPATKADSAQFFSFNVTTPTPATKTAYSGAGTTQGFIVDQTYASGANSHWYPNAAYQGTAPDGTTRNELATGLVRTVNPAPGSPTAVLARRGNKSATISWAAPENNGGSAITGYTVTALPQVGGVTRTCTTTSDTSCTVTGLTNGTAYSFTARATNAVGNSAASAASQSITPSTREAAVPGKPTALTVDSALNGSFQLRWSAPSNNGGSSITGYTVSATATDHITRSCTSSYGTNFCSISNVVNGVKYALTVVATNSVGSSTGTVLANKVTSAAPDAPSGVTASQANSNSAVKVSWTKPSTNGSAITGYSVTAWQGDVLVAGKSCASSGAPNCSISGLPKNTTFTFKVTATNGTGVSTAGISSGFTTKA